jgi:hypothetical protein
VGEDEIGVDLQWGKFLQGIQMPDQHLQEVYQQAEVVLRRDEGWWQ